MRYNSFLHLGLLLTFIAGIVSCGSADEPTTNAPSNSNGEDQTSIDIEEDDIVVPPKEYYDELMRENLALLDENSAPTNPVLFVEFDGAIIQKGYSTGQSFILCAAKASIPATQFSEDEKDEIIEKVQAYYVDANSNLLVTRVKPESRPYTTMIVGGSMSDLGCGERRGILGVAPFDRGNANKNDTGFAFTKFYDSIDLTAETIAHEAGHSFGLDHIREPEGLMYASSSNLIEGFIVGTTRSGKIQNEPVLLQRDVGKLAPGQIISQLPIPIQNPIPVISNPNSSNPVIPSIPTSFPGLPNLPGITNGSIFTNLIQLISGNIGGIAGIGGIGGLPIPGGFPTTGGIPNLGNLTGLIAPLFGGILGSNPAQNFPAIGGIPNLGSLMGLLGAGGISNATQLPNFASLAGLSGISSIDQLINTTAVQKSFVHSNYTGTNKDTLLTFLKLASAQAYQDINP